MAVFIRHEGLFMRLLLSSLIASFVLTITVTGWILFIPKGSGIAFALLLPAFWLTSAVIGPILATSDSGPANFIALILASSVLNIALYAGFFFALSKVRSLVRRRRPETPSL